MMNDAKIFGRGMSFPPRVGAHGRIQWSEGEENIREAIYVILMTQHKERLMLPNFGSNIRRLLFDPNTVTTRQRIANEMEEALSVWEPRIKVQTIEIELDPNDPEAAIAILHYRLVATGVNERMSLTVNLGSA